MKTWTPKGIDSAEENKSWFLIDATDVALGRLCTRIANVLMGKNKPTYAPHMDMGDHVVVVNAEKVKLTGNKLTDKKYYWHTGYPGGIREITAGKKLEKNPESLILDTVKGMLPKTKLGRQMHKKLKVYAGANHPHKAQGPKTVSLTELR